ncbi:NAD(P)/FAD-dependent oxidoreductase [Frigoribacterium sp. Leaf172]|uniref:protoporphyrinogen/coproporphyrinogen oxidase n=1 Tax=Frigoribacterium sp. Leaf172 TaxID=1736285 RepID=UPI0009EB6912|nr:FAD-dependent oxidoreductase [Frigoribacterium sp. Leaf172]
MYDPLRASSVGSESPAPAAGRALVVVVGGGVAGLVTARELARGGARVLLLEASGRLGGEVGRHTVAGIDLDSGAESFATRGGTVAAYLADLGLGDDIVLPDGRGAWVHQADGEAFPLPRTGLLGIPGDLADPDVLRVIGADGAAIAARLDAQPAEVGADEIAVGPFIRARMGDAVLDRLVTPIVGGVHSRHPDDLLVDRVSPGLRRALLREGSLTAAVLSLRALAPAGSAVAGLRGGNARLVDALVSDLARLGVETRLDAPVSALDASSVTVGGEWLVADAVVLAVGEGAGRALAGRASSAAGLITLVTLVVREPALDGGPRGTGVLVAPGALDVRAKALTHATVKWPWLAERTGGRHVLRLSYDSPVVERSTPDAELRAVAIADAGVLLGVALDPDRVDGWARVAWDAPLTTPATGAEEARVGSVTPLDGVRRVGGAVAGRGLASVIAQSRATAAAVLSDGVGHLAAPSD